MAELTPTANRKRAVHPPAEPMTYDEFLHWAPDGLHVEWVHGKIEIMSPASERHQDLCGFLDKVIGLYVEAHRLGKVICAPFQMKMAGDLPGREPDLLFVASGNLQRIRSGFLDGPADLVIEIVSPESRGRDRGDKYFEYEQAGILEYWLIDAERPWAEFYQLHNGRYAAVRPQEGWIPSTAIKGFRLNTNWVFANPLPSALDVLREINVI